MAFKVKKIILSSLLALCMMPVASFAQEVPHFKSPVLNKIAYQLSVEKWSTSTTANVTVAIDAALDKLGLANINDHVLANLNKIAAAPDWRLTQITRSQDKSGLETVHIEAQSRLSTTLLAALRDKAKAISNPGETYTIASLDYSPSLAELNKTHADARAAIYAAAKQEIASLNQLYPEQHYFLHTVDFGVLGQQGQDMIREQYRIAPPQPAPAAFAGAAMSTTLAVPAATAIPVSTKIVESATVIIAARLPAAKGLPPAPDHDGEQPTTSH